VSRLTPILSFVRGMRQSVEVIGWIALIGVIAALWYGL
jgi:hypothetical protein